MSTIRLRMVKWSSLSLVLFLWLSASVNTPDMSWAQSQTVCTVTLKANDLIQRAIDAAPPTGAVICLSAGAWSENIKIGKRVTLQGAGQQQTVIRGREWTNPTILVNTEAETEIALQGFSVTEGYDGIKVLGRAKVSIANVSASKNKWVGLSVGGAATVNVSNSTISENKVDGVLIEASGVVNLISSQLSGNEHDGILAQGASKVSVNSSSLTNNETGLSVDGASSAALVNSQVFGNTHDGLDIQGTSSISVVNSLISNNQGDGLIVTSTGMVEARDNRFQENGRCGIRLSSVRTQTRGNPNKMQGNGADLCGYASSTLRAPLQPEDSAKTALRVPEDYKSLQEAIDALAPGGTITLSPVVNSLDVGLTIWKPLTIRGAGRVQTVLKALSERKLIVSLIANVQGVAIEGLTITGSESNGLLIYGEAKLRDVLVIKHGASGIDTRGTAQLNLTNTQVAESEVGIWAWESATVTMSDSQVSGNRQVGLFVADAAVVHLNNTQITNNAWLGLSIGDVSMVKLANSQVTGNGWTGIEVVSSGVLSLASSHVANNGSDPVCQKTDFLCNGITVRDKSLTSLLDSKVLNNMDWGIAAGLKSCGYRYDAFSGKVTIASSSQVAGNNKSNNQTGEMCLP